MIILEILRLALAALTVNKLRSALTMLGIAVGIFTVIGVMTAVSGLQARVESSLNLLGANSFQISKYPAINFSDPRERFGNRRDIDYPMAERFKALMSDHSLVCLQSFMGGRRVHVGDRQTNPNVRVIGTDENFLTARGYDVATGRAFTVEDVNFARPIALIGEDVRSRLFSQTEAMGATIRIGDQTLTVVGLLAAKGPAFGESQDNLVLTPITTWLQMYGRARRSLGINVQAPSAANLDALKETATGMMRLVRGLEPEDSNDFEVFSNDSLIEAFNRTAGIVATGAFVISAIALAAAGVGVMNIMLVSVTERTKEIGIRKSLGARRATILTQFLIEAVVLSLVGGAAGVISGIIGGNFAGMALSAQVVFPVGWAVTGLVVCSAIGIGFGLYPAWKAAALDPIEALRHE